MKIKSTFSIAGSDTQINQFVLGTAKPAYQKLPQYPQEQVQLQEVWKNNLQEIDPHSSNFVCAELDLTNYIKNTHNIIVPDGRKYIK
jgi:hypothetical protein